MRRVLLIPAVVLALAALLPAGALAQAPDFRDRFVESGTDPDFCGTGVEVNFVDDIVGQGWETDTTFRLTFRGRTTLSYGDLSVTAMSTGRVAVDTLDAPLDEPHTELVRESGLRSWARIPGQGVVTADHGLLVYTVTLAPNTDPDAEDPLMVTDIEVLKDAGGHPDFSDPVFCEAVTSYFGIPFDPDALD